MKPEVKVGILFVVVALMAFGAALFLSDFTARLGTYHLVLHFRDVKGLTSAANVQMSGVIIGKVDRLELVPSPRFPDKPVRVVVSIKRDVHLFTSDQWVIDQSGMLGDMFVAVQRPSEEQLTAAGISRGTALAPGTDVEGGEMIGFAALGNQAQVLVAAANRALAQITATYANPEIQKSIQELMATMRGAAGQLTAITTGSTKLVDSLNRLIETNQSTVNGVVADLAVTMKQVKQGVTSLNSMVQSVSSGPLPGSLVVTAVNIRQASEDLRQTAEFARGLIANPENQKRLEQLAQSATEAGKNIESITAAMSSVLGDPQLQQDLKTSLTNLRGVTEDLKAITEASKQIIANQQNLAAINSSIANLQNVSQQGVEIAHKANVTLDRVTGTMNRLNGLATPFQPDVTTGRFTLEANTRNHWRGDVNFDLRYGSNPDSFWRVGVRSLGNNGGLNLQRAIPLNRQAYARLGVFEGRFGFGLDYRSDPHLTWEAEAWNPPDPRLDLRLLYRMSPEMLLTAGVERVARDNEPFVGVQREIQWPAP